VAIKIHTFIEKYEYLPGMLRLPKPERAANILGSAFDIRYQATPGE